MPEGGEPQEADKQPPITVPDTYQIRFEGIEGEAAQRLADVLGAVVRAISRELDLSTLDSIVVAVDYPAALAGLDRGYASSQPLVPTTGRVLGVAMSLQVLRDGALKTVMVFAAPLVEALLDPEAPAFALALHAVMHECAHVVEHAAVDRALPGVVLRQSVTDLREQIRSETGQACWSEFAASNLAASVGQDPLPGYVDTLAAYASAARPRADDLILRYRYHGDHARIAVEVARLCGDVLKFASYVLGDLAGSGRVLQDAAPAVGTLVAGSWIGPHFRRLEAALLALADRFGRWESLDEFNALGDIALAMMEELGVSLSEHPVDNNGYLVTVPLRPETMPWPEGYREPLDEGAFGVAPPRDPISQP